MLTLRNITKKYLAGTSEVEALRGISLSFRDNEFVSILGPSGCGKTTLLNIIGGLDRYSSGQLEINSKPTDSFSDREWDSYRNHSIGFVFQSYNLIPHQSVLANVELSLTISGISRAERRRRAKEVLERVGLGDQLSKKPNQMSGGQMQRVAIARALVNDPDILLADEPTGALDSETSVQIMNILKDVSKDRLVIMVTHNPELAEQYSTRLVRLLDGKVISDSDKYEPEKDDTAKALTNSKATQKVSMSFFTAVSLSLNNLMTKKARTFLTSFAGSIGIIGIALILSLSNGIQAYITRMQEDMLSSYPLTIQSESINLSSLLMSLQDSNDTVNSERLPDKIYSNNIYGKFVNVMLSEIRSNDLKNFKNYIESDESGMSEYISSLKYTYNVDMNIYRTNSPSGLIQVNPSPMIAEMMSSTGSSMNSDITAMASNMYRMNVWEEMLDDTELLHNQYSCIAGKWPTDYNEVLLVVDKNNAVSDLVLYTLGILDQSEATEMFKRIMNGESVEIHENNYSFDDFLGMTFKMLPKPDGYWYDETTSKWENVSDISGEKHQDNKEKLSDIIAKKGVELTIVGIIKPSEKAVASSIGGSIAYLPSLTREYINLVNKSELVEKQKSNPETDIFTGIPFARNEDSQITIDDVKAYVAELPEDQKKQIEGYMSMMPEDQIIATFSKYIPVTNATYEGNLKLLGEVSLDKPSTISIYAKSFSDKDKIAEIIDEYNQKAEADGHDERTIKYTDYVKLLMSSITTVIDVISGVLIAFVAISLIVSSIMIGIITYISVLERTKEIGILRAMGASKRDISRVFNAETLIVGTVSGLIGIGVTLLLIIPANIMIHHFSGMKNIGAELPFVGAIVLIAISMLLTLVAGLLPSRIAAKKDPVIALRTE